MDSVKAPGDTHNNIDEIDSAEVLGGINSHIEMHSAEFLGGTNSHIETHSAEFFGGTNSHIDTHSAEFLGDASNKMHSAEFLADASNHTKKMDSKVFGDANNHIKKMDSKVLGNASNHTKKMDSKVLGDASNHTKKMDSKVLGNASDHTKRMDSNVLGNASDHTKQMDSNVLGDASNHTCRKPRQIYGSSLSDDETHLMFFLPGELQASAYGRSFFGNTVFKEANAMPKVNAGPVDSYSHRNGTTFESSASSVSADASLRPVDEQGESDPTQHGSIQSTPTELHHNIVSLHPVHQHDPQQDFLQLNVRLRVGDDQGRQSNRSDMGNGLAMAVQAKDNYSSRAIPSNPPYPISTDREINPEVDLKQEHRNRKCSKCLQRPPSGISHPCGHLRNCLQCAKGMKYCTICQHRIIWHPFI